MKRLVSIYLMAIAFLVLASACNIMDEERNTSNGVLHGGDMDQLLKERELPLNYIVDLRDTYETSTFEASVHQAELYI